MTPEQAIAKAAFDFISINPQHHDQNKWLDGAEPRGEGLSCGTTMCIAGTVNYLINGPDTNYFDSYRIAREALGISDALANVIFYDMNNDNALRKLKKIADGELFVEDDFNIYSSSGSDDISFEHYDWSDYSEEIEEMGLANV